MSCPHTPEQNGIAEREHRKLVDVIRSIMFQANVPVQFWVEALNMAVHLTNRLPCKPLNNQSPFQVLFGKLPDLSTIRVFGCLCYPNLAATAVHKLAPRSLPCVFLGYPAGYKGFRCLHLPTNPVFISRHVVFDDNSFPFHQPQPLNLNSNFPSIALENSNSNR